MQVVRSQADIVAVHFFPAMQQMRHNPAPRHLHYGRVRKPEVTWNVVEHREPVHGPKQQAVLHNVREVVDELPLDIGADAGVVLVNVEVGIVDKAVVIAHVVESCMI